MTASSSISVLYHADCLDGFGSAYAAWRRFGDNASYRPLHHGEAWEVAEIANHDVFILDFSFAPETLEVIASSAKSVTQLDHHASAQQAWKGKLANRGDGLAMHTHPRLPLTVIFDLEKSGARLAWEHFQPEQPVPLTLRHIEDQDLWRFALPGTRAFCRALRLLPFDFLIWNELVAQAPTLCTSRYREMLEQGETIEAFFRKEVDRLANSQLQTPAVLRGEPVDALQALRHGQSTIVNDDLAWLAVKGVAINANVLFASELGNLLAEQSGSFALVWQMAANGEVKASLRSKGDFDVASIAVRYGGGGHRNAAGFRMPIKQFIAEVLGQQPD
ncbi:DHH family phosphoesterase [Dechloromonas sp. A34]|uniref:DHH family phosphoesterase n=1 Tax=Dechloromonas sp. A34 TaxID=447588 RepID=UPI002248EA37|nr:DHHA1 domain-containing protein [Dechloromonas sp. A34]